MVKLFLYEINIIRIIMLNIFGKCRNVMALCLKLMEFYVRLSCISMLAIDEESSNQNGQIFNYYQ